MRYDAQFRDRVLPAALDRIRRKLSGSGDGDRQLGNILAAVLTDDFLAVAGTLVRAAASICIYIWC